MDSKVQIKQGALSQPLLDKLHIFTRDGKQPSRTNLFGWDPAVVGMSNPIFFFTLDEALRVEVVNELLKKDILPAKPKLMSANIALYSRYSFIPWHDDASHKYSATVYLNKTWDVNWGGYLAYQEPGADVKCFVPTYNACVCYPTPLMHTVQLTSISAPMRESLQIFVNEFEE